VKLHLPVLLCDAIVKAAKAAFPRECCGLMEGLQDGETFRATALHPARNLAGEADRFEIDPADHIAAAKAARSRGHRLIGCYHSHPDGPAQPSVHDRAHAAEENFLWLIAATGDGRLELAAFVYRRFGFEEIVLNEGADLVTSSSNERS
jgi:proteasome lid subunit RPN8/RPN11